MNPHQRIFVAIAITGSIFLHAAIAFGVMKLPLGELRTDLFQLTEQEKFDATPIEIIEEDFADVEAPDPADDNTLKALAKKSLKNQPNDPLKKIDTKTDVPKDKKDPKNNLVRNVDVNDSSPPPAAPKTKASPAGKLDMAAKLIALAKPEIKLPELQGPTDDVDLPDIDDIKIGAFDGVGGDDLKGIGLPDGQGNNPNGVNGGVKDGKKGGTIGSKGIGTPVAPLPPVVKKPNPNIVKPKPPIVNLPEPPTTVTIPPLKTNKPVVKLDSDFVYELYTNTRGPGGGGLLSSNRRKKGEPAWFEVRIRPRATLRQITPLKKNVVYVIDTSGSISKRWSHFIKKGVGMALDKFNKGDKFNIVMFKDKVSVLDPSGLLDADNPRNITAAKQFLSSAKVGGYTDVNRALGKLIVRNLPDDRVYQIVLITDGVPTRGSIKSRDIINLITRENNLVAGIYCVGVGDKMDKELLEFLAYRNKGIVAYPKSDFDATRTIVDLAVRLRYPILKDAQLNAVGVEVAEIYPRVSRDIYQGQTFSIYGRYTDTDRFFAMAMTGSNGPKQMNFTWKLDFNDAKKGAEDLPRNWAFWKIYHLSSEMNRRGDVPELKKTIQRLSGRYGVKAKY